MHFSLAVILDGTKTLEEVMAPFQEVWEYDPSRPYVVFEHDEDEKRREYETGTTRMVNVNGRLVSKYDDMFAVRCGRGTKYGVVPEGLEVDVPFSDTYETFEDYMRNWCDEERDPITGEYGYWHNPNSQWDWYVVGGRWYGLIEAKIGAFGRRSYHNFEFHGFFSDDNKEPYPDDSTHFDVARVCDVIDVNPDLIRAALTPDGVWHDRETYEPDAPKGEWFIPDPEWNMLFYSRFIEPYQDCVLAIVDYHT